MAPEKGFGFVWHIRGEDYSHLFMFKRGEIMLDDQEVIRDYAEESIESLSQVEEDFFALESKGGLVKIAHCYLPYRQFDIKRI